MFGFPAYDEDLNAEPDTGALLVRSSWGAGERIPEPAKALSVLAKCFQ
jgi:hypothetical protein